MSQAWMKRLVAMQACLLLAACGSSDKGPEASSFKVGGRVTGLAGSGLVVRLNDGELLPLSGNARFAFAAALDDGASYSVAVATQPTNPSQTCTVANASGAIDSSSVDFVQVNCVTDAYTVGGTVSGLGGTLVLQNNGGDDVTVATNGPFTFTAPVASGSTYGVTIKTQTTTARQTCVVANPGGTVAAANIGNVAITCTAVPLALTASNPPAATTGVLRSFTPTLYFSAALNPATATTTNVSLAGAGAATGISLSTSADTVTITPARTLLPMTAYTLTATTGLRGSQGEQLAATATSTFTTRDGAWRTAAAIDTSTNPDSNFSVAASADGSAVVVWNQYDQAAGGGNVYNVWANRYTSGSGWGVATLVESGSDNAFEPSVAIDASGNAIAVWYQYDGTTYNAWASRQSPGGNWSAPVPIENSINVAYAPKIAMDQAGNAIAVWYQFDNPSYNIWANRYTPAAGWGTATLIESGAASAFEPTVAMDSNGNAMAVWNQNGDIVANRYAAATGWGAAVTIEAFSGAADSQVVAMNAGGSAVAAWKQYEAGGTYSVWASRYTPGAGWGAAAAVTGIGANILYPEVGIDSAGNAIAVWFQYDGSTAYNIVANRFTAGAGWGIAAPIETATGDAAFPSIAMDASGNAIAVWYQADASFINNIWANRYIPGQGWGGATLIETGATDAFSPVVAMDPSGNAVAAWRQAGFTTVNRFE